MCEALPPTPAERHRKVHSSCFYAIALKIISKMDQLEPKIKPNPLTSLSDFVFFLFFQRFSLICITKPMKTNGFPMKRTRK